MNAGGRGCVQQFKRRKAARRTAGARDEAAKEPSGTLKLMDSTVTAVNGRSCPWAGIYTSARDGVRGGRTRLWVGGSRQPSSSNFPNL